MKRLLVLTAVLGLIACNEQVVVGMLDDFDTHDGDTDSSNTETDVNSDIDTSSEIDTNSDFDTNSDVDTEAGGPLSCRWEELYDTTAPIFAVWGTSAKDVYAAGGFLAFFSLNYYSGNIFGALNGAHKYNRKVRNAYLEGFREKYNLSINLKGNKDGPVLECSFNF